MQGFDITIENPRGSERSGVDENGKPWSVTMQNHYGYFKRTQGKDGDQIDVFVGANPESAKVFVVDQIAPSNSPQGGESVFDESKVMLGFNSVEEAREAYLSNYEDGWQGLGAITETTVEDFKEWLYDGAKQRKAFAEYVENRAKSKEQRAKSEEQGVKQNNDTAFQSSGQFSEATPQELLDLLKKTGLANDVKSGQEFWDKLNSLTGDEVFDNQNKSLDEINKTFNTELQQQIDGTLAKGHIYKLGVAEGILNAAGFPMLPIELAASRLSDKSMQENHPFDLNEIQDLPKAIHNPLAILDSKTQAGSKVIITNLTDTKGNNFVVAMRTNVPRGQYGSTIQINQIRSIYPKDNIADVINWINRGNLLRYADKIKTIEWITQQQSNSADVDIRPMDFKVATNIIQKFENPTVSDKNRFHAVWHGSPHAFDKFSLSKIGTGEGIQAYGYGLYFTDKESIARSYAGNEPNIFSILYKGEPIDTNSSYETGDKVHIARILFQKEGNLNKAINDTKKSIKLLEKEGDKEFANMLRDNLSFLEKQDQKDWEFKEIGGKNLYKVKIHGDKTIDDLNFIRWDKPLTEKQKQLIAKRAELEGYGDYRLSYRDDADNLVLNTGGETTGEFYYKRELSRVLGSDKAASEFLLRAGIDGIQYPTEFQTKGEHEEAYNYVVFDENALEIEEHIQFVKRPDGTVYGFVDSNNVIYLNPDAVNLNTPIHEYGHLWVSHIRKNHRDLYERAGEVFGDSEYMKQVKADKNYAHLNEEQQLDEAIARAIGNKGESVAKGDVGMLARIKNWINDVWKRIGAAFGVKNLTPDQISTLTWQDITDIGVSELLRGEELTTGDKQQSDDATIFKARDTDKMPNRKKFIGINGIVRSEEMERAERRFDNPLSAEHKLQAAKDIVSMFARIFKPISRTVIIAKNKTDFLELLRDNKLSEAVVSKFENMQSPIQGVYHKGKTFINVADNETAAELLSTVIHENNHDYNKDNWDKIVSLSEKLSDETINNLLPENYHKDQKEDCIKEFLAFLSEDIINDEPLPDLREAAAERQELITNYLNTISDGRFSESDINPWRGRRGSEGTYQDNPSDTRQGDGTVGERAEVDKSAAQDGDNTSSTERGGREVVLPPTITIDGIERSTTNWEREQIHPTEEGVRNFWKWFGYSKVVDKGTAVGGVLCVLALFYLLFFRQNQLAVVIFHPYVI